MKLIIIQGPNKGTVFDVPEKTCTIGRAHANQAVLYDRCASAYHAVIEPDGRGWSVRDLGSANGTYVDGLLVTRALLRPGSTIQCGDTVLAFERPPLPDDAEAYFRIDAMADEETAIFATVGKDETEILDVEPSRADLEALREDRRKLFALYRVNSVVNEVPETRRLLCRVLEEILEVLSAERGFALLREESTGRLVPAAMRRRHAHDQAEQLSISKVITVQVIEKGQAVLSTGSPGPNRGRSAMCAPLHGRRDLQGIIYVDTPESGGDFSARDLQLLTAMANQLGTALENARLAEARIADERFAAIGQAVAGLSHYIKNILSCMQGGAQIVQRGIERDEVDVVGRGWAIVRRNERKIADLVLDMLNYSGANEPLREPCDANRLAEEVAEPLADEAGKDVRVETDLAPGLPVAMLDARAIHRCLLNLVANAIDALPDEGGLVRLTTALDQDEGVLRVAVCDNGRGIEPDLLPTMFDVFVSTKGSRGTGLGLAVCKKLVEEHGGRIEVESTPGQGSTFTLVLPVTPPDPRHTARLVRPAPEPQRGS